MLVIESGPYVSSNAALNKKGLWFLFPVAFEEVWITFRIRVEAGKVIKKENSTPLPFQISKYGPCFRLSSPISNR